MTKLITLGFLLLGIGCTSAGDDDGDDTIGPFCGDLVCNGFETAGSCPGDCGGVQACSETGDACGGDTICISGRCESAFPRVYRLTNVTVTVPTTNPNNGQSWDVGGGAPDLYLGNATGTPISAAVQDQFSATFAGPFEIQLIAGGSLRLDAWDEDVTNPDPVLGCLADPITPVLLRARSFSCSRAGMSLSSVLSPK